MESRLILLVLASAFAPHALADESDAKARLRELQVRVLKQDFSNDSLRKDVLAFARQQVGTPLYPFAIDALNRVPGPLDKLDPLAIGEEDRKFLSLRGLVGYVRANNRAVAHVAISFDGAFLATSGWDNVVHVYKLGGKEPMSWAELEGSPSGIAFSVDGKTLAAGCGDQRVLWWDLTGAKPKRKTALAGHKNRPFAVAFAPTGILFASGCYDPVLRLWKTEEAEPEAWAVLANEEAPSRGISSLAFSHDGKYLVAGSHLGKETLRIWDAAGSFLDEKTPPPAQARVVACSPTAPVFAFAGDDTALHVWSIAAGRFEKRHKLAGHPGKVLAQAVKALAFSPDGKLLASAGHDKHVRLWDVANGEERSGWQFNGEARALAFASDGRHLAIGNANGTVYVMRLESSKMR